MNWVLILIAVSNVPATAGKPPQTRYVEVGAYATESVCKAAKGVMVETSKAVSLAASFECVKKLECTPLICPVTYKGN